MVKKIKKFASLLLLILAVLFFYTPLLSSLRLPIPADAIVGLYHPYRDLYSNNYPNGIPFKNFLITDPVRQTYVWKELAIDVLKTGNIPSWNPYEMTGKPLLGNFQSGALYPLNVFFVLLPFSISWSLLILLQTLLFGLFMFLYLRNLKINQYGALLGSLSVSFSGFSIAWLEWGNIVSTALWLPLILFTIDKINIKKIGSKALPLYLLMLVALVCSFFAGHLQSFAYLYVFSIAYFILRWFETKDIKKLVPFIIMHLLFVIITIVQWYPTLQFILLSSRSSDQSFQTIEGWFIPWKHLIQFIVPDFFGNPATLNYWGTWNYGELVGYVGIMPLMLALYAFYKKTKISLFYAAVILICLVMALPTGISSLPFVLNIPFISTAQPTRLLFPIVFSLSVLAALGMDKLIGMEKIKLKQFVPLIIGGAIFGLLLFLVFTNSGLLFKNQTEMLIAKRNIIFPSVLFCIFSVCAFMFVKIRNTKFRFIIISFIILLSFLDLLRFAQKFTPFTSSEYLYPRTKIISFLISQPGLFRVAVSDQRIMPPNFLTHYKISTIEGYDPLYLRTYAEYVAVLERNKPDVSEPFGFNRIITPHNYNSLLFDFLNTKYLLSFDEIKSDKFIKVLEEGQTKVYENKNASPRLFFAEKIISENNEISTLFKNDLRKTAVVDGYTQVSQNLSVGLVSEILYSANIISMKTNNVGDGYLVFSDAYYPTWSAYVDDVKTQIYKTNHAFRGIFVPAGIHTVQFKNSLL